MTLTVPELIKAYERRLTHLQSVRGSAFVLGDIAQVDRLDNEITQTQDTLNQLRSIP